MQKGPEALSSLTIAMADAGERATRIVATSIATLARGRALRCDVKGMKGDSSSVAKNASSHVTQNTPARTPAIERKLRRMAGRRWSRTQN